MVSRFGRYELLRPLGKGGMAEVYLARQRGPEGFEKRLVIKRVLTSLAQDPRFLRLFFEEARLHASLSHGNLVSIFDFGRVGNDYFLAMELVDGADLARLLGAQPDRRLSPELLAYLGAELCHALQHVHGHGLVHGDVTPRNVLVSRDGEVKLADFGVARSASARAGVRGTVAYMAPEQARGEPADARADLYSLGLVVAEAATGTRARNVGSGEAGLDDAGRSKALRIDGPLAALVARATSPATADRYADAGEMAAAFEAIATELGATRLTSSRALSSSVRALPSPEAPGSTDVPVVPEREQPASYFRDATTAASFVDEILAVPPARGRPRWPVVVGAVAVGATLVGLAALSHRPQPAVTTRREPSVPPREPAPTRTDTPVFVAPPPAVPVSPHRREPTALLDVVCLPWCIVDVDGTRRGEDGRAHHLRISPGRHRIDAQRLEDRQSRTVVISADVTETVRFDFD